MPRRPRPAGLGILEGDAAKGKHRIYAGRLDEGVEACGLRAGVPFFSKTGAKTESAPCFSAR